MNYTFPNRLFALYLLSSFASFIFAGVEAPYQVGTWGNFCQGSVSHTFDDYGQGSVTNAAGSNATGEAAFDAKGFHATIFVITGSASATTWTNCKYAFSKGHEIASHSVSHPQTMPTSELGPSQQTIKKNVPGEMSATIAYPNCNTPGDAQVLQYYVAGRNCNGSLNNKTPSNFAQVGSKGFGSGQGGYPNDANSMNSFANQAATNNGWAVYLHHGIGSDSHSWAVTSLDAMKTHLDFLDQNRGKIWCETFGNVARYIKERDAVSVAKKDSTDNSFTITVTDNLADSIFNYPLSIRRPLPNGWSTASVTQKGTAVQDTIITDGSTKYVMFKAIPDGGDVVISKDPVSLLQGTSLLPDNFCPVVWNNAKVLLDPRYFNGSNIVVTLFDLNGKTLARYSLDNNGNRITLPMDKIKRSAFIVKIVGGNKTFMGTYMPQF
jgi:hypothetical protein